VEIEVLQKVSCVGFSFIYRVIVLFHFSSRRQANPSSRRARRLRRIIRLALQTHSHVCSSVDHSICVLLPLFLQAALEFAHGALHHHTLNVTLDFLFKIRKWFRILLDGFLNLDSQSSLAVVPSVVSDIFESCFELG